MTKPSPPPTVTPDDPGAAEVLEPPAPPDPHERRAASQRDAAAFTARTGRPTIVNPDGSWAPLGRADRRSPRSREHR